jgi:transposase-like protein
MKRTREMWARLVAEYRRGEMTQAQFCGVHGVAVSTLQYWNRRLPEDSSSVQLVPVRVRAVLQREPREAVVELSLGDVTLRIVSAEAEYVGAVVRAVARPC